MIQITPEQLMEIVADESQPLAKRERAAEILEYYTQYVKAASEHHAPEDSQSLIDLFTKVAQGLGGAAISAMWFHPEDDWFRTMTARDGTQYRVHVSKKYHGPKVETAEQPLAPLPAEATLAQDEPASIPLVKKGSPSEQRFAEILERARQAVLRERSTVKELAAEGE